MDLYQGGAHELTHLELDRDDALVPLTCGIDVLDPRELGEEPLQGLHRQAPHLLRGGPWELDEDVDHGDRDLRVLLPWSGHQSQQAHPQHGEEEQRGQG